jgi:hypothetical protein
VENKKVNKHFYSFVDMADSFAIRDEALSRFTSFRGGAVTSRSVYDDALGFTQAFDSSSFFHRAVVAVGLTLNLPVISGVYSDSALYLLYFNGVANTTLTFLPDASNSINNLANGVSLVLTSDGSYSVVVLFSYLNKWYIQPVFNGSKIAAVNGDAFEDVLVDTVSNVATVAVGEKANSAGSVIINRTLPDVNASINRTAYGAQAGAILQGAGATAIGRQAGNDTQGFNAVAIGNTAGKSLQSQEAIAIGVGAGELTQANRGIGIGVNAGRTTQGTNGVAIGFGAGQISQGVGCIAIGANAGNLAQTGLNAIAIGTSAGVTQQAAGCVSIGNNAGPRQPTQGALAIGNNAGPAGAGGMGASSIAIGENASAYAGAAVSGIGALCVGLGAGSNAAPLANEICIGNGCVGGIFAGGLNFGANMRALALTAVAGGVVAVPATTAGFIPITWNGTNYRIPVYLP